MLCSEICARPVPSAALGWGEYSLPFSVSGKARQGKKLTRRNNLGVPGHYVDPILWHRLTWDVTGHHDLRRMEVD